VPRPAKDYLAPSPGGVHIWRRVWRRWDSLTTLGEFADETRNLPRSASYPGTQEVLFLTEEDCQEQVAWPGVCGSEGVLMNDLAVDAPLVAASGPLGQEPGGGYVWVCLECYLTADTSLDPACISERGVAAGFVLAAQAATPAAPSSSNVNQAGVIAGAVVGGRVQVLYSPCAET
jgi:hypothetical protein